MRKMTFDIGFSPGDIVVFTRALADFCEQYPNIDVRIDTCCPSIFQYNPLINKKKSVAEPEMVPFADNLSNAGYDIGKIATDSRSIFHELINKNELKARFEDPKWIYDKDGVDFFFCNQKKKPRVNREWYKIQYEKIHEAGWSGMHFSSAFYYNLEKQTGLPVKQTALLPALYISDEEKGWMNQVEQEFGYRGKFWLINSGNKMDYPLKQWGHDRWQHAVDLLEDKIQFVQIGELGDNHVHEKIEGTLDLRGKTDLRQLIRLCWHAHGAITHVSLLHHLMASWQKPCVTIAGGREARRWESYPHSRYLDTNGSLTCSGFDGCWQSGKWEEEDGKKENKLCKNWVGMSPKCMAMIKPERVAEEVMNFYYGGILRF